MSPSAGTLEELGDQLRGPPRAAGANRLVVDVPVELRIDRGGDVGRAARGVVHASAGSLPCQSVGAVVVLLEVVAEWEEEERPARRGELHRGREAAVADCDVTRCEI